MRVLYRHNGLGLTTRAIPLLLRLAPSNSNTTKRPSDKGRATGAFRYTRARAAV